MLHMHKNSLYIASRLARMILCSNLPSRLRAKYAFFWGITVDDKVRFGKNLFIEAPHKLTIGQECIINNGVHIYTGFCNDSKVVIGNKVGVGLDSLITTNSHIIGPSSQRCGNNTSQTVVIEDGVWIGANVTVLQGVTIGHGGIIAAGAVVTKSTEPDCLYAGVPAKKIRNLSEGKDNA